MTLWNPVYRVKVDGYTVTDATLAGMTITSGRTDIYSQAVAGYCSLSLLETNVGNVPYDINQSVSVEVKDSAGNWTYLFGGFLTDVSIEVASAGSTAISQRVNLVAVGALARLARAVYSGNIASDQDGDQIYSILEGVLFNTWLEVPAATQWTTYNPTTTWANAENSGLGEIDRPGDYDLDSQNGVLSDVLSLVSGLATSGLGYIYEDAQGRIGYADSTHRSQYLAANGYLEVDAAQAQAPGMRIAKRAGNVRNSVTLTYTSSGNSSVTKSDAESIATYGQLATTIDTTLKNSTDANAQAEFYLTLRANPQYEMTSMIFQLQSPELDNADRDALLSVFMGLPLDITNLPSNMSAGRYQGFVEGWTWTASYNRLEITLNLSPLSYSLQAMAWQDVPATETYLTITPTLEWLDATIVA